MVLEFINSVERRKDMKRAIAIFILLVLFLGCSRQSQKKLSFQPELAIGKNTQIEGAWFSSLGDFYVDADTTIYCVDMQDCKIKVFGKTGNYLFSFGRKGRGPGEFLYPVGIAVSSDGFVYILDKKRRNISKFTKRGQFLKSRTFIHNLARFEIFDSGNLIVEVVKFNRENLNRSLMELCLLDGNLKIIKPSIYKGNLSNLIWINLDPDHVGSFQIPFSPEVKWKIIENKLYVGYNEKFTVMVFDANGNHLKNITKEVKYKKVTNEERKKWIKETLEDYSTNPRVVPKLMKKSLKKVTLPKFKPAFTKLGEFSGGLVVFENPTAKGTPGILYNKDDEEVSQAIFEYDDFKSFYGKYYRITGGVDKPFTLTRYRLR